MLRFWPVRTITNPKRNNKIIQKMMCKKKFFFVIRLKRFHKNLKSFTNFKIVYSKHFLFSVRAKIFHSLVKQTFISFELLEVNSFLNTIQYEFNSFHVRK